MKKLVLIFGVIFLCSSAFAQKRSDLKGPAYKNFKAWESTAEPTVVYVDSGKKELKGPAYKNLKPWQKSEKKLYAVLKINSTRKKLMSPAYKNQKPWKKYH